MIFKTKHKSLKFLYVFIVGVFGASCQLSRMIWYNFADINDYKIFPSRLLQKSSLPFQFYVDERPLYPKYIQQKPFEQFLRDTKTVAFLIIKNDTILYEKYFFDYTEKSIVPSFSMAKSVTSLLIGCAIDDKYIQSVNEPVTNYIPELKKNRFDKVTIRHLLQMTSGIKFKENYFNPFGDAARFYYGNHLRKKILKMKLKKEPGKQFEYVSGNTQVLGWVLERALKNKTITQYLQERIWTPLGMEFDATWSIDNKRNGIEKTFCCLNARARDFAKIGRLYLHNGNWNGRQIVSSGCIELLTRPDTTQGAVSYYQYQWWLATPGKDFLAEGFLGQYIYVNPSRNLIIVRLGKKEGKANWWAVFRELAMYY